MRLSSWSVKDLPICSEHNRLKKTPTVLTTMARRFIDTYMNVPIIRNDRDELFLQIMKHRSDPKDLPTGGRKKLVRDFAKYVGQREFEPLDPLDYAAFDKALPWDPDCSEINRSWNLAHTVYGAAKAGYSRWGIQLEDSLIPPKEVQIPESYRRWYSKMSLFRTFINTIAEQRFKGSARLMEVEVSGVKIYGNEYAAIVTLPNSDPLVLMSYSQVLMFKDLYYGRSNAVISALVIYRDPGFISDIECVLAWFFECISRYGNKGYEIAKSIEALAKTNIIRKCDPVFADAGPHQEMLRIVREKELTVGGTAPFQADKLEQLLKQDRPLEWNVELFGLQKLSGHPLVDPTVGGEKVRNTARRKINYKLADIKKLRNNFCRMYTEGYIRKNTAWPPLAFSPVAKTTRLYQLYSLNTLKITSTSYDISDWEGVTFKQDLEFNYYPNFTDLMDDRSISYYRDEMGRTWDPTVTTRSDKRLLIEMLSREEVNIKSIVERVVRGDIPWSWMIVSLYPKEREFKINPRMFGMMVFEMRVFFATAEANIAENVFPNLPPQTMTLSQTEIQEMFHSATQPRDGVEMRKLYNEFDLSGWNLHFHPEVTDPIGRDLEDLHGMPGAFTVIHHFFKKCVMSVRVRECEPNHWKEASTPGDFPHHLESNLLWGDHEVGIEGLAQKVWTCPTYSMIDLAVRDFGFPYYLIGQADNQIVAASIPIPPDVDGDEFMRDLARRLDLRVYEECDHAGHELNLDECIHSERVVTYSKNVYIDGAEYYTSVKAYSRVFPHSASDFPSIINSMGALSGQCLAAAERTKIPLQGFFLSAYHSALYLSTLHSARPVEAALLSYSHSAPLLDHEIFTLLCYPGELGGMPIGHVLGFLYKGGADPTSKALASLKLMSSISPPLRRVAHCLHSGLWMKKKPDMKTLLDDPYSIPVDRKSTPEMAILNSSVSVVRGRTRNEDLSQIMSLEVTEYENQLVEELLSVRPFNPVLLSDIMGWSIVGIRRSILKMFTSTQTIQSLLQGTEESNPCSTIIASGTTQYNSLLVKLRTMPDIQYAIGSVFVEMNRLRAYWTSDPTVQICGVTSYTPIDFPLEVSLVPTTTPGFKTYLPASTTSKFRWVRGKEQPYIGRATSEKRSEHGFKIITSSAPERAVKKLADVITQPGIGDTMKELVSRVAETRADVNLVEVEPFIGKRHGGTIDHRYASRLGHRTAQIIGVGSIATQVVISTDNAAPISGGGDDYPCMIQESMVAGTGLVNIVKGSGRGDVYLTLQIPSDELTPLEGDEMIADPTRAAHPVHLSSNVIAYAPHIYLKRVTGSVPTPLVGISDPSEDSTVLARQAARRMIHKALHRSNSASSIADRGTGTIHLSVDLQELKGLGIRVFIHLMCIEVACFAVDAMYSRASEEVRWTPGPVISSLSSALAASLSQYVAHPMFKQDHYVTHILSPSRLKYTFSRTNLQRRLSSIIGDQSLHLFRDVASPVYQQGILLFLDEPSGETWRAIVSAIKRSVTLSGLLLEMQPSVCYTILRRNLTVSLSKTHTEDAKLDMLYRFCQNLRHWSVEKNLHALRTRLSSILEGKMIERLRLSCAETLRLARGLEVDPMSPLKEEYTVKKSYTYDVLAGRSLCRGAKLPILSSQSWSSPHLSSAYDRFTLRRLQGRLYGMDSSVGYSYLPLIERAREKVVVLIGCGYGSGAAVLLVGGALHVAGLDLEADRDPKSRMDGTDTPPAISRLSLGASFSRVETTQRETGDIFRSSTSTLLRTAMGLGALYVVDVPLLSRADVLSTLCTLAATYPVMNVALRYIGLASCFVDLATLCTTIDIGAQVIPVAWDGNYTEAWILFTLQGTIPDEQEAGVLFFTLKPMEFEANCLELLGGGLKHNQMLMHGIYSSTSDDGALVCATQFHQLLSASVGDLAQRFTYSQWTDVIHSLLIRKCEESGDWRREVEKYLLGDHCTVMLGATEIPVSISNPLRYKLTRILPRCH